MVFQNGLRYASAMSRFRSPRAIVGWILLAAPWLLHAVDWWQRIEFIKGKIEHLLFVGPFLKAVFDFVKSPLGNTMLTLIGLGFIAWAAIRKESLNGGSQAIFRALDKLKEFETQGREWLDTFTSTFPTSQQVADFRKDSLAAAQNNAFAGVVTPKDLHRFEKSGNSEEGLLRMAELSDNDPAMFMNSERITVYNSLHNRVRRLGQLITKIES